jgi:hypothetical protein
MRAISIIGAIFAVLALLWFLLPLDTFLHVANVLSGAFLAFLVFNVVRTYRRELPVNLGALRLIRWAAILTLVIYILLNRILNPFNTATTILICFKMLPLYLIGWIVGKMVSRVTRLRIEGSKVFSRRSNAWLAFWIATMVFGQILVFTGNFSHEQVQTAHRLLGLEGEASTLFVHTLGGISTADATLMLLAFSTALTRSTAGSIRRRSKKLLKRAQMAAMQAHTQTPSPA